MAETIRHPLDTLIEDYYRVCELNNIVPVLMDYKIESAGRLYNLSFRINRKPAGLFVFNSENGCKDAVISSYFINGIETKANK